MKKKILKTIIIIFSIIAILIDIPRNPEQKKYYINSKTPEVRKNEEITIKNSPEHKTITEKANQNLSERRAQATTNYLTSKKLNPNQLKGNTFSESKLTNKYKDGFSTNESQHKTNRRTILELSNKSN